MSMINTAVVGLLVVGGSMIAADAQRKAAKKAERHQVEATEQAIEVTEEATDEALEEQRRQYNEMLELLRPIVERGEVAASTMMDLAGLGGDEAYQRQIQAMQESPEYQATVEAGEEAILQNASATGGLRGGNVQRSLSQFRPQVLSGMIQRRFQNLQQIAAPGQTAAAQTGQLGGGISGDISRTILGSAQNIGSYLTDIGSYRAGRDLATGRADAMVGQAITSIPGILYGQGGAF